MGRERRMSVRTCTRSSGAALRRARASWAVGMLSLVLVGHAFGATPAGHGEAPDGGEDAVVVATARERQLVRLVRQDCGACHGLRLTGGLGPALTPQALRDKPVDALVATTLLGRPGTAMPPWAALLTPSEARWVVLRLQQGFPHE